MQIHANIIDKLYAKCHRFGHVLFSRESVHSFHQMLKRVLGPAVGDTEVSQTGSGSLSNPPSFSRLPSAHTPRYGYYIGQYQCNPFLNMYTFLRLLSILAHLFE